MKKATVRSVPIAVILLAVGVIAEAQQPKKVPRIGFLSSGASAPAFQTFQQGLRELGYVEGQNVLIEYRSAEGKFDRYPELAAELVSLRVDVIVATGTQAALAAKQTTATIPIVASAGDLVGTGLVASLARPGGNVTGTTNIDPDFSAKRLELLKEAIPKVARVAILYHGGPGGDEDELKETETAARALKVHIQSYRVKDPSEFGGAYAEMTKKRAEALIIFHGSFTLFHRRQLLDLATKNRLPTMCGRADWIEGGGLISYGRDSRESYRRAAIFVDKILKGTKPADIPVEQPMKFELVINLKTANQIGLTIPQSVLFRADKVIK
jgi:putative tryptophan/tyrosine transport system substrate-binding protein